MKKFYFIFLITCFLTNSPQCFSQIFFPDSTHLQKWEVISWTPTQSSVSIYKTGNPVNLCNWETIEILKCDENEQNCSIYGYYSVLTTNNSALVFLRKNMDCNEPIIPMYRFIMNPGEVIGTEINNAATQLTSVDLQLLTYQGIQRYTQSMEYTTSVYFGEMDWIEGIGSTVHPFYPLTNIDPTNHFQEKVTKVHRDGQLIYLDTTITSPNNISTYFPDSTHYQTWEVKRWWWFACDSYFYKTGNTVTLCGKSFREILECDENYQNCSIYGYYTIINNGVTVTISLRETMDCNDPIHIAYRFNLNDGDHVNGCINGQNADFNQQSKQDISYLGTMRKTQFMQFQPINSPTPYYMNWIEGIGSNVHPFYPLSVFDVTNDLHEHLVKVHRDGQLIYHNEGLNLSCSFNVNLKLLLEGPYNSNTGEMTTGIGDAGLIPTSQPFADYGYTVNDTTTTTILTNTSTVDWVLVELRDAEDPTIVRSRRAGLLDNQGNITSTDGYSALVLWADKCYYYISVIHRNHLSVMTANPIHLKSFNNNIDFTTMPLYGNNAAKLDAGVQVLWAGDSDASGAIDAADRSNVWNDRNKTQYLRTDFNLDGVINAADRSDCWNNRNLIEQMP